MNDKSKLKRESAKKNRATMPPQDFIKGMIIYNLYDCYDNEWRKYFAMWDLCADMNRPLFLTNSDENSSDKNDGEMIENHYKSIVDFPTFLLHCYKLWVAENDNVSQILAKIPHNADNLLEFMWYSKTNKHAFLLSYRNKNDYKDFVENMFYYRVLFDCFVIRGNVGEIVGGEKFTELAQMQREIKAKCDSNAWGYRWLYAFLFHLRLNRNLIERDEIMQIATYENIAYPSNRANLSNFVANLAANISPDIVHKGTKFLLQINSDGFLSEPTN